MKPICTQPKPHKYKLAVLRSTTAGNHSNNLPGSSMQIRVALKNTFAFLQDCNEYKSRLACAGEVPASAAQHNTTEAGDEETLVEKSDLRSSVIQPCSLAGMCFIQLEALIIWESHRIIMCSLAGRGDAMQLMLFPMLMLATFIAVVREPICRALSFCNGSAAISAVVGFGSSYAFPSLKLDQFIPCKRFAHILFR